MDKIAIFLARFNFHVHDLDPDKAANLLLSLLDGETFEKILIQAKPKRLEEIQLNEIEQMLSVLLDTPMSFRAKRFYFHTLSQQLRQPLSEYIN